MPIAHRKFPASSSLFSQVSLSSPRSPHSFSSGAQAQHFRHLHHRGRAHRHAGAQCCEKPFRSRHRKRRPGGRFRTIGNLRLSRRHYPGGTGSERDLSSSVGGFNRGAWGYANSHHRGQTCNSRRELWLLLDSLLYGSALKTAVQQIQLSFQSAQNLVIDQIRISQSHCRQSLDIP